MINYQTELGSLFILLHSSTGPPGGLAERVHTITINTEKLQFFSGPDFWTAATRIVSCAPSLCVLDAANTCNHTPSAAWFRALTLTAGRTLTSLAVRIGEDPASGIAFSMIARMETLERLSLDLNIEDGGWDEMEDSPPPLVLPRVRWLRLEFFECT